MSTFEDIVNNSTYSLELNDKGEPYVENNWLLLRKRADGNVYQVEINEDVCREFHLKIAPCTSQNVNTEFSWSHKSILLLLDEYKKRVRYFRDPKKRKKELWREIQGKMKEFGYSVPTEQIDKKFRNLKRRYLEIRDNNNKKKKTGTGGISWPYYDIISDIFTDDKTVNPICLISSLPVLPQVETNLLDVTYSDQAPTDMDTIDSIVDTLISTSSNVSATIKDRSATKKQGRRQSLVEFRKKILEIEQEKLAQLKDLTNSVKEHNLLQKERNTVLRELMSFYKNKNSVSYNKENKNS